MSLATTITLARDGKSAYSIVVPSKATAAEKRAAQELQHFLKEISGASLDIRTDRQPLPRQAILLGTRETNRHIRALRLPISSHELGEEGYVIRTAGNRLVLGGGRPRGTMYAVYGFLEDVLGCRWYAPQATQIPHQPELSVPDLDIHEKPAFEYREPFYTEAWDKDWAARNRLNGNFPRLDAGTGGKIGYHPFVHSFYNLVPAKKYAKSHPEYFALVDGKRKTEHAQLCLTNRDVVRIAVEQVRQWIRKHPEAKMISVSQNDCGGPCACPSCRKVVEEEGSESGVLLRFVNAVAREVHKTHPDRLIDTLAYQYTEPPPAKTAPFETVRVRLAPISNCFAHPADTCPENKKMYDNLQAWAKVTNNLYIWHYNTNFANYPMPFPDLDELQGSTRAYHKVGVKGIFFQGDYAEGGGGELAELRSWVLGKMLWNPQRDIWQLTDEFLRGYYGEAAKPMREYLSLLHEAVKKENIHFRIYDAPDKVGYLRRDLVDKAEALFEQAEAAVASQPEILARVQKARLAIDYTRLHQAANDAERQKYATIVTEKVKRFGFTQVREGQPVAEFLKSIAPKDK